MTAIIFTIVATHRELYFFYDLPLAVVVVVVVVVVYFTEKHDKNLKTDNTTHTQTPRIYALKYPNVLKHCK